MVVGLEVADHCVAVQDGDGPRDVALVGHVGHVAQGRRGARAVGDERPVVAVAPRRLAAHIRLAPAVVVREVRGVDFPAALYLLVHGVVHAPQPALALPLPLALSLALPLALPDLRVGVVPGAVGPAAARATAQRPAAVIHVVRQVVGLSPVVVVVVVGGVVRVVENMVQVLVSNLLAAVVFR